MREHHPEALPQATTNMFDMIGTDERDVITDVLERAGLSQPEASSLVSVHLASDDNKTRLKDMCAEALGKGVFGAPSFCVDDYIWFGSDRLEQMYFHLSLRATHSE